MSCHQISKKHKKKKQKTKKKNKVDGIQRREERVLKLLLTDR
jgi:hypothetical protein